MTLIQILTQYVEAAFRANLDSHIRCPVCGRGGASREEAHDLYFNAAQHRLACRICWCPVGPSWWERTGDDGLATDDSRL